MSTLAINYLRGSNIYMDIWWSFCFPGFGQWFQGKYFYGLILMTWEFFINVKSHLNTAIYYSMVGRFQEAKDILDERWFLLYIVIYIFAIWDCYHSSIEIKKRMVIASHERQKVPHYKITPLTITYLANRNPIFPVFWSLLLPGSGHFILQRKFLAIFMIFWWTVTCYYSFLPQGASVAMIGDFQESKHLVDPQWFLFIPSLYMFAAYDCYLSTLESNKFYEEEKRLYLADAVDNAKYPIPYPEAGS
ncbi:hypothetical protein [Paenibacillus turpanensis]|uniref:hypothetical protein n=1 Tax=Paenibacillus turpanensis TaxID=2689078 RepID=UPI001408C447|nr:hypothetical protein [Paenibacillus turpanensis]